MPWKDKASRARYQKKYNARPENIRKRSANNKARRAMEEKGLVKKGDGKDVGHVIPQSKGGTNAPGNLRVQSRRKNRGYARGKPGQVKTRS